MKEITEITGVSPNEVQTNKVGTIAHTSLSSQLPLSDAKTFFEFMRSQRGVGLPAQQSDYVAELFKRFRSDPKYSGLTVSEIRQKLVSEAMEDPYESGDQTILTKILVPRSMKNL